MKKKNFHSLLLLLLLSRFSRVQLVRPHRRQPTRLPHPWDFLHIENPSLKMVASAARGALALRTNIGRSVAFVRKIPWMVASSELREHFAQFGHVQKCTVPFDKETGFHKGMSWIHFSSEELHNAPCSASKTQSFTRRPNI